MSSSSPAEPATHRGQVEPVVALAAALVVGLALGVVVGSYQHAMPEPASPEAPDLVAERLLERASDGGVVHPAAVDRSLDCPAGWACNVTLDWHGGSLTLGEPRPPETTVADRLLAVCVGPGRHRVGRLEVSVWR